MSRAGRTWTTSPAPRRVHRRRRRPPAAVRVDAGGPAGQQRAAGEVDAHVAADRVAHPQYDVRSPRCRPRPPPATRRTPRRGRPAPVRAGRRRSAPRRRSSNEVAVRTGSSAAVVETLSPMPTTAAAPPGRSTRSTRMPATFAPRAARRWATSTRTRGRRHDVPLDTASRPAAAATATARPEPRRGEQHAEGQRGPRRGHPGAVEAPAPGGLVLGDHDQPVGPRPAPARPRPRWSTADSLTTSSARHRAPEGGGVEWWAAGPSDRHRHYD